MAEKRTLHHIEIHPAENGHMVSHHYIPAPKKGEKNGYVSDYPSETEKHVFSSPEDVADHVEDTLNGESPLVAELKKGERKAEANEPSEEPANETKRQAKHDSNNPMGIGRPAPNRQY